MYVSNTVLLRGVRSWLKKIVLTANCEQSMITNRSLLPGDSGVGISTFAQVGKNILRHFHQKKKQKLLINTILKSINKKNIMWPDQSLRSMQLATYS